MNEKDCMSGEYYWVLVEFYFAKPEYQIALYTDDEILKHDWSLCGTDEGIKYYPDDVPPYARQWISKIISHVERPPHNDEDFQDVGTTYEED